MRFLPRSSARFVALLLLAGCSSSSPAGCELGYGDNGMLGNGTFAYTCEGAADVYCDATPDLTTTSVPPAVARGSRFGLRFDGRDGEVEPVSRKTVETTGAGPSQRFLVRTAGDVGFVVLADAEAVDATRLRVIDPDGIGIGRATGPDGTSRGGLFWPRAESTAEAHGLPLGPVTIRAVGLIGSTPLSGTLTGVTWSVDPPDLATIVQNDDQTGELTTLRPGPGRVRASRNGVTTEARIEVAATPGSDGAADAGTTGGAP